MNSTLPFLHLDLQATRRNEVTDLRPLLKGALARGDLPPAQRFLFVSHHTTAGFPDPRLRLRLGADRARLAELLEGLRDVFPPGAGYQHDRLEERHELSATQRAREPLNADAHLSYIGGGFTNTLLSHHGEGDPIWLVDFDGSWETRKGETLHRQRRVTIIGLDGEREERRLHFRVPVPSGAAAVPLSGPGTELLESVEAALEEQNLRLGRVRLRVEASPPGAGVTVNEAEALLVERDLSEVLSSPLRYARAAGLPRVLEALRFSPERRDRILGRTLKSPSSRLLRLRREASLAVVPWDEDGRGAGRLLLGRYQSPILLQQEGTPGLDRMVTATLLRFV